MNLNITVYQNNQGQTQMLQYTGGNCSNEISLKFHCDPLYSGFNHYESILKIKVIEGKEHSHPDTYNVEDGDKENEQQGTYNVEDGDKENEQQGTYNVEDGDKENEQQGMILDDMFPNVGHGKPFPTYLFSTTKLVEVQYIPSRMGKSYFRSAVFQS